MNKKLLEKVGKSFEEDVDNIPGILDYYSGLNGFTVEKNPSHPDHLWTILDRIESDIMFESLDDAMHMDANQRNFILYFISKWKKEIEPYCVKLESE